MIAHARYRLAVIVSLFMILMLTQTTMAENEIVLEYYYSASCGSCKAKTVIIDEIEQNYTGEITVIKKDVAGPENSANHKEWEDYGFKQYPSIVINGEEKIPKTNITKENLENIINDYIAELGTNDNPIAISEELLTIILLLATVLMIGILAVVAWKKDKEK